MKPELYYLIASTIAISALIISLTFNSITLRRGSRQSKFENSVSVVRSILTENNIISQTEKMQWNLLIRNIHRHSCAELELGNSFTLDKDLYEIIFGKSPEFAIEGKGLAPLESWTCEISKNFLREHYQVVDSLDIKLSEIFIEGPFQQLGNSLFNIFNVFEHIAKYCVKEKMYDSEYVYFRLGRYFILSVSVINTVGLSQHFPYTIRIMKHFKNLKTSSAHTFEIGK